MEAVMKVRMRVLSLLILLFASLALAGGKKKVLLPTYVLNARSVVVLIDPTAGTSMSAPLANKTAQEDVEKALAKWGRFSVVLDSQTADLVITVRKGSGRIVQPTIGGLPTNDRPVILQPRDDGMRVGVQHGHPPGSTQTDTQDAKPHPQMEAAPPHNVFVVYEGHIDGPLDRAPVWQYEKKDALKSPDVPAVAEFRKLIDEAEKQHKPKP